MHISLHSLFFVALSSATMIAADGTLNGNGSIAQIPACGITCAQKVAPQTACITLGNFSCQCSDSTYRSLILTCLDTQCSLTQDKQDAIDSGNKFCLDQGFGTGQASNGSGPSVGGGPTHGNNITSGGGSASGSGASGAGGASGSGASGAGGAGGASGSGASGASGSGNGGSSMGGSSGDNAGKSSAGPSSKGAIRLVASLGAVAVAFAVLV